MRESPRTRIIARFLTGMGLLSVGSLTAAFLLLKAGMLPVNADSLPSSFETKLATMALRASVARSAKREVNVPPVPASGSMPAAEIYHDMCARCHGSLERGPAILGSSFYPPAPNLPHRRTQYSDTELFWIIKHGIRNTGMPGWGKLLSDGDIWQLALLIKKWA